MGFRDHINASGVRKFFYVRISGLPYVWLSTRLPAAWEYSPGVVEIDGEFYTHHATLTPGAEWAALEDRAEPWNGLATASQLSIDFVLPGTPDGLWEHTDPWMQILAGSIHRGAWSYLVADLPPTAGTAELNRVSNWPSHGIAHIGIEAVTYSSWDAGPVTLDGVTRGRYGSWPTYHAGDLDQVEEMGAGPIVADHPIALAGRIVEVWVGFGYEHPVSGEVVPWGATICSSEDRMVYRGVVRGAKPDRALGKVTVQAEGLRSLLAADIGTRLPRGVLGGGSFSRPVYICEDNRYLSWAFYHGEPDTDPTHMDRVFYRVPLQYDAGGGSTAVLPDGWYPMTHIQSYIDWTMCRGNTAQGHSIPATMSAFTDRGVSVIPAINSEGERHWSIGFSTSNTTNSAAGYSFWLLGADQRGSLWREFGFVAAEYVGEEVTSGSQRFWSVTAERRCASFYLPPAPSTAGRQVMLRHKSGPVFTASPGWTNDAGQPVPGYLRLGEEVVTISAVGTYHDGERTYHVATLAERGLLNSLSEEIYVEWDAAGGQETVEVVQGLVFPRTSWGRAGLYLAHMMDGAGGNGPWDVGWRGGGAALPQHVIDAQSWLDVAAATEGVRDIALFGPDKLETVLARNIVTSHAAISARWAESSAAHQLVARPLRPPLRHELAPAWVLDASNLRTIGRDGIGWEVDETGIIGTVIASNVGYDAGAGKALRKLTRREATTQATWPDSRPLDIDVRDIADPDEAEVRVIDLASNLAAMYGRPFLVLRLPIALPDPGWLIEIGDEVRITHPLVIQRANVRRGVTNLAGRAMGCGRKFRTRTGIAGHALVIASEDGTLFAGWGPSLLVHDVVTATTYKVRDNWDSYADDGKDLTWFPVGSSVICARPGAEASAQVRTITTVSLVVGADDSTLTLNASPGLTPPFIITPNIYSAAGTTDYHRQFAYLSGGDGKLDRPSGPPDPAYEYQ